MPGNVLRSVRRLQDLPVLAASLGYAPLWRELPAGCFRTVSAAAIVGRQGEFEWYGVAGPEGSAARVARRLASRGLPAAVFGLEPAGRLVVAAGEAPPLAISLDRPDPLDLARLTRCAARPGEQPLAALFRITEALAGQGVDERFFSAFRRTLTALMAALPARMPTTDRHAFALLQLTRILFLYFLEGKGWLGGPRFLREAVDRCLSERRSLQRDLLHPLFFGTLNRPFASRSRLARRFGNLPFLNGGLFEPHPLERRWRVSLPTPVLRDAFDTLFERFHFTLAPSGSAPGDLVAPDMLGRVFEGVMEPEERHASGSYYTPAALVEEIVGEALAAWLEHRAGIGEAEARRRLADPDLLTRKLLREARILDPAVGSGAFLLGALQLLAGPDRSPGIRRSARLRIILRDCLFGVDLNAAAVRLAELRLWLELIAADPGERPAQVSPLPNLDALVRQGDSLIDPSHGLPLPPPSRLRAAGLAGLRAQVVRASGEAKRGAVAALARAERELWEAALAGGLTVMEAELAELLLAGRSATLFGERRGLGRSERARLAELRRQRRRARQGLRVLARTGQVPWFHYPVHCADVLARGGFDLVLGNPPWVRAEALEPAVRAYLRERYRWFRPAGSHAGYRHLPDLAVAFLERALELTTPGGVVAFLIPAKLATTGYAAPARAEVTRTTTLLIAADLRTQPAAFAATVYPMVLMVRRTKPPEGHQVRLGLSADAARLSQSELGESPWVLADTPARAVLVRLARAWPTLGERFSCRLGVKTGRNEVFLDPPASVEPELVRWAVRGRDVAPFRVQRVRRLLWPCDDSGRPLTRLPSGAARYLAAHLGTLQQRADRTSGCPWALFRTRPAAARHRVVWSDVARQLTAAPLTGSLDRELIPLNTCYVLVTANAEAAFRLAAWLNSTWCRAAAQVVADPASGGFARFNARVVAALPCPPEVLTDSALLELGHAGVTRTPIQEALDDRCAELLGLEPGERVALAALARASSSARR